MKVFCTKRFKDEYHKLIRKNSYKCLTKGLTEHFADGRTIDDVYSGTRLNGNNEPAYIKKRIGGRGKYRIYYVVFYEKQEVYIGFVHPKTGSLGYDNIDNDTKTLILKEVLQHIQDENYFEINFDINSNALNFTLFEPKKKVSKKT